MVLIVFPFSVSSSISVPALPNVLLRVVFGLMLMLFRILKTRFLFWVFACTYFIRGRTWFSQVSCGFWWYVAFLY
jgi:hypothetical protein